MNEFLYHCEEDGCKVRKPLDEMFETTYHEDGESYYSVKCDAHIGQEYDPRLSELTEMFCKLEAIEVKALQENEQYVHHYYGSW